MAMELGGPIMLNMIMVGALCALPEFPIKNNDVKNILKDIFSGSKLELNFKALDMGESLVLDKVHP